MNRKRLLVLFVMVALTALPLFARHHAVFLHGWNSDGGIWSNMKTLLRDNAYYSDSDLHAFSYYSSTFGYSKSTPIQTVAEGVAREITEIYYDSGRQPVDLVTHSMGGLVVRAMLAYDLIDTKCIGRFISLAAPHYGQNIGSDFGGYQAGQMKYGSLFLWDLADAWHFKGKQIPETLCIVGASQTVNGSHWDGLVHVWSAALGDSPVRYVKCVHSAEVSANTKAGTGAGAVVGYLFGGFWGAILGAVTGNAAGKADTDNVIYKCKQGTSDDVYKLVRYYLSIGYAYDQSWLNYDTPASDITSQGGIFFQILDSTNTPARFKSSENCLVHTYWHVGKNKRIVAEYLEHGDNDHESQGEGIELVYGTMPEGNYNLTAYASQTTPAFTSYNVPVRGGRMTVVRLRAWDGRVFNTQAKLTFDAMGGTDVSPQYRYVGDYADDLPVPTYKGYLFDGWYTAKTGGMRFYWWDTIPSAGMTLYARWSEKRSWIWESDTWQQFQTGGCADWTEVSTPVYDGVTSFRSGTIDNSESTWLEKSVQGPGRILFHWLPSTERGYDFCTFAVDNITKAQISGASDTWSKVEVTVDGPGTHVLRWNYAKDSIISSGSDCVWVDGITWQPEVSVTLDGNGGALDGQTSCVVAKYLGDGFAILPSPLRKGYGFDGWFTMRNGGVRIDADTIVSAELSKLYAHWNGGVSLEAEEYSIVAGVQLDGSEIVPEVAEGYTLKVAGLPSGMRYDARTGMIVGTPKAKAGSYTVTFTASKKGEKNQVATVTLEVAALPDWATGTFAGLVEGALDACPCHGSATMTVAANGKVSGKIALDGTNWTFSAASYAVVERPSSDVNDASFIVAATAKAGKLTRPVSIAVRRVADGRVPLPDAVAEGTFGDCEARMWRNMWKDKTTAAAAKAEIAKWEGVYTLSMEDGGYMSLTIGKNGDVKASGKLSDGTRISATSPLMYDTDFGYFAYLYAAPSVYKGGCLALAVGFDGAGARDARPYRLAPVMFGPQWTSRNPQATGAYGEGFERSPGFTGAYYDKLATLYDYYESLRLSMEAVPSLAYTYKETRLGDDGRKVTESRTEEAGAVDTFNQDGLTVSVDEKGKLVVTKATRPMQDKETKEWSYDGANDGAMTLSFTQATGIFKGSYTFWYDYVSAVDETTGKETNAHTSKKASFEGIMVQGAESMRGFFLWDATGAYDDPKTGKGKTYRYKESYRVQCQEQ